MAITSQRSASSAYGEIVSEYLESRCSAATIASATDPAISSFEFLLCAIWLSQDLFQLDRLVGLLVAIFHDHRRVDGDPPLRSLAPLDRARTGHHHRAFRDHQRFSGTT